MDTTIDWRPLFVASAASMLRVKASKKWPGWQDAIQEDAAKAACRQAAADIEGIPALRARAEAAEAELAQARADLSQAHGFLAECHKQLDELEGILSDALAARARAEAEVERLRTTLGGTR